MLNNHAAGTRRLTGALLAVIIPILVLNTACDPQCFLSDAKAEVVNVTADHDVVFREGADYALEVKVTVKNVGKDGVISINPAVSCSEGEWERKQRLFFKAGEVKTLTYNFHELSVNAKNIHYGVAVCPKAKS